MRVKLGKSQSSDLYLCAQVANCFSVKQAWFCERLQLWLHILPDILFMDEAQFPRDGITSTRNLHSWGQENPDEVAQCHGQN